MNINKFAEVYLSQKSINDLADAIVQRISYGEEKTINAKQLVRF